jgi:hypothetical protein
MSEALSAPDINYAKSTRRLFVLTASFGVIGSVVASAGWGGSAGGGFALGSLASLLNLWLWHALTMRLSGDQSRRSRFGARLFAARFLALFALGYGILKTLNVEPLAAILGLLTSAMAVLAEIVIELALALGRQSAR